MSCLELWRMPHAARSSEVLHAQVVDALGRQHHVGAAPMSLATSSVMSASCADEQDELNQGHPKSHYDCSPKPQNPKTPKNILKNLIFIFD